jgi:outer membrane protein TolC
MHVSKSLLSAAAFPALILLLASASPRLYSDGQEPVVSLEEALAAAGGGPDARLGQVTLSSAEAQYAQAKAQNLFGLSGTAGGTRNTQLSTTTGFPTSTSIPIDSFEAGVQLTAPLSTKIGVTAGPGFPESNPEDIGGSVSLTASSTLWDGYPGGKGRAAVQQAEISLRGARVSDEANRKSIAYNVKQAYYTMLSTQRQLTVLQGTLTQRQQELARTQTQFDLGNATGIDLKQAQVNVRSAELDLSTAQKTLVVLRERLSALVGWPLDRQYAVAEVPDMPIPGLDITQAIKTALGQRADLRQFALNKAAGELNLTLKKSQVSPTVSANGSYDWSRDLTANKNDTSWRAGLQVSVPILDSGLTSSQVRQARLQLESLQIQEQKLASSITTDVKNAVYNLQNLLAASELADRNLDLAKDQYELAKTQHDSGVISTLDLLTASVTLTTAQVNQAKSRSDVQLGVLALQNAMGD